MRAAQGWPVAIAAVLVLTVAGNLYVLRLASDGNAGAVESDYYRKAVDWDSTQARVRRSDALGWALAAELRGAGVWLRLVDRTGAPVAGAHVAVEATHNLDAVHPLSAAAITGADGTADMPLALRHRGLWELRFDITRGAERFGATLRRERPGP